MEVQSNTTHTDYNYTEIPTSPSSSIPPSIPAIETESEPHDEDSIYRCDRCRPSHVIITNNVFFYGDQSSGGSEKELQHYKLYVSANRFVGRN